MGSNVLIDLPVQWNVFDMLSNKYKVQSGNEASTLEDDADAAAAHEWRHQRCRCGRMFSA